MDSPLPIAQPWTPPDMEMESSPRSDYFSDPYRPPSTYSLRVENRWMQPTSRPETPAQMHARCDTPPGTHDRTRPKAATRLTEPVPYTPKRSLSYGNPHVNGALRYPYTPDSSRILRRSTELPSSPTPWDEYSEHSSSPVQDALSSCLAHFENLIQSQQPDEDQMEYIVGQFEAMTSFLSAPDAQTRKTDDHLFSEPSPGAGLGIIDDEDGGMAKPDYISKHAHEAYVAQVGAYIEGVKRYIEDLKMRLDEVKMLNGIQLDVINDLRRQMKAVRQSMRSSLDMRDDVNMVEEELERLANEDCKNPDKPQKEFGLDSWATLVEGNGSLARSELLEKPDEPLKEAEDAPGPRYRKITIIRKPQRRSFWGSIGQALDSFGDVLREE
ncbi:hypothetical protein CC86DRAFT_367681 [Ophiobolus disseminans]|uniref:Uncharacterized protein n=1 Tax=Ophiobolus disseminans TaxID=1469910 RepID=A0A6A7A9A0_9PLEO|nr:hypothetical protein CC86DRAFT_367681 [Ophiobolus disseminans]